MVINIKDKNQFIASYLRPISALTDAVIIKSKNNKLECITNNEQGLILYAAYNLEIQNDLLLNIPNVKKLEKILSFIESEELNLDYKENSLSYKDKKMRFKYHFLDDNIIQAPKLSVDKILNLPYDIEFNMDSLKKLAKWFLYTLAIYVIFLISTKSEVTYIIIFFGYTVLSILMQIFLKSISSSSYNVLTNKLFITSDDYKGVNQKLVVYIHNTITAGFIISLLLLLFGFVHYFNRQYKDHYKTWDTKTFLFGSSQCKNL